MVKQVISKQAIAQSFGKAAHSYDSAAHFQRWVGNRLLEQGKPFQPDVLVDLGCGTGYFSAQLTNQYPSACYVGMDLSESMLNFASKQTVANYWVAGDAEKLPFANGSIDLIYSSLAIQWCADIPGLFKEIERVLSINGRFMFSTLLDGSLKELKASWASVDQVEQHVNEFPFQEDYRMAAEAAGLSMQSLFCQEKVLQYQQVRELTRELKLLGAHNIREERPKHLTGKTRIRAFIEAYERYRQGNGYLPATYQVLFGVVTKEGDLR